MTRPTFATALVLLFASSLVLAPAARAGGALDKGRLDPAWFPDAGEFREADEIDYLWVKPGFELDGRKLRFAPWPDPAFLGEKASERDEKDVRLAKQMTATMHELFAEAFGKAFGKRIELVESGEQIRVEGRIVDASTGATAAKVLVGFGAGSGSTTIDLRFVDAASGELLVAIHHRAVSGTSWSTTDSKFAGWVEEMTETAAKSGFEKLWKKGDRVKE